MTFKEGSKLFWLQFPIFFFLGLGLLSGFWFFGEDTKNFLMDTFFEHFAMSSIVLIFLLCMLVSGLFLIFIGTIDSDNRVHGFLYKYIVRPPVELAITLSSVAFSLSSSLLAILLIDRNLELASQVGIGLIYIALVAGVYWFMARVIVDGKLIEKRGAQVYAGFILLIGIPFVGWLVIPTLIQT